MKNGKIPIIALATIGIDTAMVLFMNVYDLEFSKYFVIDTHVNIHPKPKHNSANSTFLNS